MSPIRASEVNRFVREEGEDVLHSTGMRCFCMGKDGQLDPNCKAHDVTGSIYDVPKPLVGLFSDIMQRKELAATGLFLPGDALFSPLSTDTVSEGDKITLLKPLPYGSGDALTRVVGNSDRLLYKAVSSIFCMDEHKIRYIEGEDFRLYGKTIIWKWEGKVGKAPRVGHRYTIKYRAYIDWIAFFPPMERFSRNEDIGSKVMLRKLHVIAAQRS
jgi:hypothetical protein